MDEKYFQKDKWWVSPYNFKDEVTSEFQLPEKVRVHDATLRDGEQTPGVVFRPNDKIEIAKKLDEIGIDRIEAGMPAVSGEDFQAIKQICRLGLKADIYTFARAMTTDVDKAVECGADGVIIEIPIGYPKLKYQFGWTWKDVFSRSAEVINYAKQNGLHTVFFPYDTTRATEEDLKNLLESIMEKSPPDSLGVVDTMGCALPETMKYLVRKVKSITGLPVEVHTHNDFGMAVSTELAGVTAGAEVVHSCVNGLGERTGNAALEELIVGLHVLLGYDTHYRIDKLTELSELVQSISGISLARNKPISGEANFTRESGIGVDLVINEPLAMFGLAPGFLNRQGKVVLGKKSGKLSVKYYLEQLDIKIDDERKVAEIVAEVKRKGIETRRLLTIEEFKIIVDEKK
jgi:isopropylmalate/homocitrate/citramalate synthase